jgi:hypothetical protein
MSVYSSIDCLWIAVSRGIEVLVSAEDPGWMGKLHLSINTTLTNLCSSATLAAPCHLLLLQLPVDCCGSVIKHVLNSHSNSPGPF